MITRKRPSSITELLMEMKIGNTISVSDTEVPRKELRYAIADIHKTTNRFYRLMLRRGALGTSKVTRLR